MKELQVHLHKYGLNKHLLRIVMQKHTSQQTNVQVILTTFRNSYDLFFNILFSSQNTEKSKAFKDENY